MMLKSRAKRIAPGAAAMALFLMAFLGVRHERQRDESKPEEIPPPAPVLVEVGYERLARVKAFPADIQPWIRAEIRPGVAGRVIEKFANPGSEVKKGDPLLRLDETRARIAVDNALARHTEATRALVETGRLQKTGLVSETAAEVALEEVRASRIQLDEAREVLARHTVRSPISGTLTSLEVPSGGVLEANQILGIVADLEKLRVFLNVPEADLALFQPGEKLPLRTSPKNHEAHRPEVLFVSPAANPKTGLFKIEAVLNNKKRSLSAGTPGTVEIEVESFPEGPVVPTAAIRFSENGTTVHREENGKAISVTVRIGTEIEGMVPVLEGLHAGERVFVGEAP
jgi:RND family efflux transporter MFP subunit